MTCGSCTLKSQSFLARESIGLKNCKMSTGLKPVEAKCNSHSYNHLLGGHSLRIIAHCIVRAKRRKLTRMHAEFMEHTVELPSQEITQKFCNILYQKKPTKKLFPSISAVLKCHYLIAIQHLQCILLILDCISMEEVEQRVLLQELLNFILISDNHAI